MATRLRSKLAPNASITVEKGVAVCNGVTLAECSHCGRKGWMFTVCLLCSKVGGWKVAS